MNGERGLEQAASALLARGIGAVVVTLGAAGAYVATAEHRETIPGWSVEARDTTGAGDVFNGALAVALAERMSLRMRYASRTPRRRSPSPATARSRPHRGARRSSSCSVWRRQQIDAEGAESTARTRRTTLAGSSCARRRTAPLHPQPQKFQSLGFAFSLSRAEFFLGPPAVLRGLRVSQLLLSERARLIAAPLGRSHTPRRGRAGRAASRIPRASAAATTHSTPPAATAQPSHSAEHAERDA